MPPITLRVRTQLGTWRLKDVESKETIGSLRRRIEKEHKTQLLDSPISLDAAGRRYTLCS